MAAEMYQCVQLVTTQPWTYATASAANSSFSTRHRVKSSRRQLTNLPCRLETMCSACQTAYYSLRRPWAGLQKDVVHLDLCLCATILHGKTHAVPTPRAPSVLLQLYRGFSNQNPSATFARSSTSFSPGSAPSLASILSRPKACLPWPLVRPRITSSVGRPPCRASPSPPGKSGPGVPSRKAARWRAR